MNEGLPENLRAALQGFQEESDRQGAAGKMVEAAQAELEAALISNDMVAVGHARDKLVARFETMIDLKIAGTRRMRGLAANL